jgi:riboflavin biosynthesis pyrimidine reductase
MLRGLADVILVGAGTARTEKYGPAESGPDVAAARLRRGQPPAPPIAVVTGRLALDPEGPLLSGPGEPTIVVTHARSSAERRRALAAVADVVVVGEEKVDLAAALGELSVRGLTRVLCEGGPHLLAELVVAGLLDELCLTVSPIVRGGGALSALAGELVSDGAMQLVHVLEEDGTLLTRWRPQRESSTSDRL